mmetsp:Transcript_56330/g.131263  ORF Transcript_56330/g.131263 Transcript_56330/m.131263 type:complete len:212 (-) Transcript_56330:974-1609(-)
MAFGISLKSPAPFGQCRHTMLIELPKSNSKKASAVRNCLTSPSTWPHTSKKAEISVEKTAKSMRMSQCMTIALMEKIEYRYCKPPLDASQSAVGQSSLPAHQNKGSWRHMSMSNSKRAKLMRLYMLLSLFAMLFRTSSAVSGPSSLNTRKAFLISSLTLPRNLRSASIISSRSMVPLPSVSISSMILLIVSRHHNHKRERWKARSLPMPAK